MGAGFKTFTAGSILTASDVQNYLQDQSVMVFGGTAARSSAIGTANFEEGMLTYLTDVDKLQVYTGASFVDVYPAAATNQGLTLINTTSFSAVSSGSVNDVFSSTYENYQIVATLVGTTVEAFNMRLRVGGADNSTNNYYFVGTDMNSSSASLTVRGGDPNTSWRVGTIGNDFMILTINLGAPQTANKTAFNSASGAGNATNEGYGGTFSGFFSGTTSFTGFTILGASNFSGTVRTYGVAN